MRLVSLACLTAATCLGPWSTNTAPAAVQDHLVDFYNEGDGLPTSRVRDVRRAPGGEVWFATRGGLFEYDGKSFKRLLNDVSKLVVDVKFVRFDEAGIGWIVIDHSTVVRSDTGEVLPSIGPVESPVSVDGFAVLGGGDDAVPVVTSTAHGVQRWSGSSWESVRPSDGRRWAAPIAVSGDHLVVGAGSGVQRFDRSWQVDGGAEGPYWRTPGDVRGLAADGDSLLVAGDRWVGRAAEDGSFELLAEDLPLGRMADWQRVEVCGDGEGGAYVGNYWSLVHVGGGRGTVEAISQRNGLGTNGVNSLSIDDEGLVWAGSTLGALKVAGLDAPVYREVHGLFRDEASAILALDDGRMIVGHYGGLTIADGEQFETVPFPSVETDFPGVARVMDLGVADDGTVWIAGTELGVGTFDVATGAVEFTALAEEFGGGATAVEPVDGGVIVSTVRSLLFFDGEDFVPFAGGMPGPAHVRQIDVAADGTVYLATTSGVWSHRGGRWTELESGDGGRRRQFYNVLVGSDGRVWCAGVDGLWLVDGERLVRPELTPALERPTYALVEDLLGRIWCGTDRGFAYIEGDQLASLKWMAEHTGFESNRAAAAVDTAGRVWMGTVRGLTIFDSDFKALDVKASVAALEIVVDERRWSEGVVDLQHGGGTAQLRARASTLRDPDSTEFRYRLEGGETWTKVTGTPVIEPLLGQLAPGGHRVEIQTRLAGGPWSPSAYSPELRVHGPLWGRWWVWLTAGAALVIATLVVYRVVSGRRQMVRLEREVEARSRELETSLTELAKSDRLRALGLLAAGIAHDLRNVLTVLTGSTSILRERTQEVPGIGRFHEIIDVALDRATQLSTQLQTFATGGDPNPSAVALDDLVLETATFVLAGSRLELQLELEPDLNPAQIDAAQIRQVLENLLVNGRQCQPDGGWLSIVARNVTIDESAAAGLDVAAGDYVELEISDGGPGIPEKVRAVVFDPFFSTKSEGSGLGLATARSVVRRHGGAIELSEHRDGGAQFHVFLPTAGSMLPRPRSEATHTPRAHAGRVLVVDDDVDVRRLSADLLSGMGFEPEIASTSAEAKRAVQRALDDSKPIAIAVIDQTLPGDLSGVEILELLRQVDPELPAVATSGYANGGVLTDPAAHGFQSALPKPFRADDLERALAEAEGPRSIGAQV